MQTGYRRTGLACTRTNISMNSSDLDAIFGQSEKKSRGDFAGSLVGRVGGQTEVIFVYLSHSTPINLPWGIPPPAGWTHFLSLSVY